MADAAIIAVGWATVELERAEATWRAVVAPGTTFADAPGSAHLGARCRVATVTSADIGRPDAPDRLTLVLLEPSTEGRLAATLARHGEGWCATWVADPGGPSPRTPEHPGPLGPERLVPASPTFGPHRLLVHPATIEP